MYRLRVLEGHWDPTIMVVVRQSTTSQTLLQKIYIPSPTVRKNTSLAPFLRYCLRIAEQLTYCSRSSISVQTILNWLDLKLTHPARSEHVMDEVDRSLMFHVYALQLPTEVYIYVKFLGTTYCTYWSTTVACPMGPTRKYEVFRLNKSKHRSGRTLQMR